MRHLIVLIVCCSFLSITTSSQPGSLRTVFGNNGHVLGDFSAFNRASEFVSKVLVQSDGKKVVVFGRSSEPIQLARFNTDGTLDQTFGQGGFSKAIDMSYTRFFDASPNAVMQSDGKVVVAGNRDGLSFNDDDFAIARFTTAGELDATFGDGGIKATNFGYYDEPRCVKLLSDGKLLVGGRTIINSVDYIAFARYNSNGTLDGTFGTGGKHINPIFQGVLLDMEIMSDGKIMTLGTDFALEGLYDFILARFNSNGLIDNSFDTDGYKLVDVPASNLFLNTHSMALQADGKTVLCGGRSNGTNMDFAVMRFNVDGTPDNTFHGDGLNITHIGGSEEAIDVIIQADGKIILGGYSSATGGPTRFAVARYETDGDLDATFGVQGSQITAFSGYDGATAYSIILQSDGQLVAAGSVSKHFNADIAIAIYNLNGAKDVDGYAVQTMTGYYSDNGSTIFSGSAVQPDGKLIFVGEVWNGADKDFIVARYNTDGTLDNSFGDGGVQKTNFVVDEYGDEIARDVKVQSDGKIVVVGTHSPGNGRHMAIARYNADGSLDETFHNDGLRIISIPNTFESAWSVELQTDGKIVIGGEVELFGGNDDFVIVRLNADGTNDASFDGDGRVTINFGDNDNVRDIAIQSDGKIIAVGTATTTNADFGIARYNQDGSPDLTFGTGGKQTTGIGTATDFALAVVVQPDGKIVVAGYSLINSSNDFAVVRYNSNGSLDTEFGNAGIQTTDLGGSDIAYSLELQNGKIVVSGYTYSLPGEFTDPADVAIVKYNADGSLNECFGNRGKVITDLGAQEYSYTSILSNNILYTAGFKRTFDEYALQDKSVGLIIAYNTTGGPTSLNCPPGGIVTVNADPGVCSAVVNDPIVDPLLCPDDATGTIKYELKRNNIVIETGTGSVKGKQFSIGQTTVTYTVESNPSLTCSFIIEVLDKEVPVITNPASAVQNLGAGCSASLNDFRNLLTVTDNCTAAGSITVVQTPAAGAIVSGKGTMNINFVATDASGNTASCQVTIEKRDLTAPTITCPNNVSVNAAPGQCSALITSTAIGIATATDNCPGSVTVQISSSLPSENVFPVGVTNIKWTATDVEGNSSTCIQTVTVVDNQPPVITGESASTYVLSPPNHTMRDVTINYTATDNCAVTSVITVTSNEPINGVGDGDTDPDWVVVNNHLVKLRAERSAQGTGRVYTVTITATDPSGNTSTKTIEVRVPHNIKNPHSGKAFIVGSTVPFEGEFWDKQGKTHTAKWLIDETTTAKGIVIEPSGNKNGKVTGSYKFTAPGVYKLQMNVTDQTGVTHYTNTAGDLEAIVVIFDPNGGNTYGGGYFNSPAGALKSNPSATGKASYGFAMNYFKNSTNPKGETQFEFKVGTFEFNALNFEYLVISNSMAQFKGTGKIIGGQSGVGFTMTVVDGQLDGTSVDKIRMKIYNKNNGSVIYDNQFGASDATLPTQAVGSNSVIVISGANASMTRSNNTTQNTQAEATETKVPNGLDLIAYPNPSTNNFSVTVQSDAKEKIIMQVVDMYGRVIETRNVTASSIIKFGERYNAGTYFIRIIQGKEHREIKLVKISN